MPTIEQILTALKTTRAAFANVFMQVQVGLPEENRRAFEAIAPIADDTEAFRTALQYAQNQQLLRPLVERLINERQEDGTLTQALAEAANPANANVATLQAMVNAVQGFTKPDTLFRGIFDGMRWTGKITVTTPSGGQVNGTCILIGPHLVLTAWHVVRSLFLNENGIWKPDPTVDGKSRIRVTFDDYLVHIRQNGGLGATAGAVNVSARPTDWCVGFSPCHQDEITDGLPDVLTQLENFWDYAIIRLNATPGTERRWASLDARAVVPAPTDTGLLFQYPAAQPLQLGQGTIGQFNPPNPAVARLRFLHQINALGGSSGGPCFDRSFMLFGLHQGVWNQANGNGAPAMNRGIPIVPIIEHIKAQHPEGLPKPDPSESPIWELTSTNKREPVIGLNEFQSVAWRLAMVSGPKILLISGPKGGGKTFCSRVLSEMLPDGGHLKIMLNAGSGGIGQKDAQQLVADICTQAGIATPTLTDPADTNSTATVWLKAVVVPALMTALDTTRQGKLVWITLTDLNNGSIDGPNASELLFLLYEQTLKVDWLRIVLDGIRADIPDTLADVTERFRTKEVEQEDVELYLRRFFATLKKSVDTDLQTTVFGDLITEPYRTQLDKSSDTAMKTLAAEAKRISDAFRKRDSQ